MTAGAFAYAHTHGAVRYIQHGAHTVLTDLLLRTNSSNACGVTEREGRAGPLSVAGVLLLLSLLMQLQDDTMALLTVLDTLYVPTASTAQIYIHAHIHMTSEGMRTDSGSAARTPGSDSCDGGD